MREFLNAAIGKRRDSEKSGKTPGNTAFLVKLSILLFLGTFLLFALLGKGYFSFQAMPLFLLRSKGYLWFAARMEELGLFLILGHPVAQVLLFFQIRRSKDHSRCGLFTFLAPWIFLWLAFWAFLVSIPTNPGWGPPDATRNAAILFFTVSTLVLIGLDPLWESTKKADQTPADEKGNSDC